MLLHLNKWLMLGTNLAEASFNQTSGAIRVGDWKLMLNEPLQFESYHPSRNWTANCSCTPEVVTGTKLLFNLADDPHERDNQYDAEPQIARRLRARLHEYYRAAPDSAYVEGDRSAYAVWMANGGFIVPWNGTASSGDDDHGDQSSSSGGGPPGGGSSQTVSTGAGGNETASPGGGGGGGGGGGVAGVAPAHAA